MRQNTSEGDSGTNQGVQLFITANGKLEVARSDTLDFEILSSVTGKLQDFGSEVFKDGCDVDSSLETKVVLV